MKRQRQHLGPSLCTVVLLCAAAPARAHERSSSRSTWTVLGERVQVQLTLAARDAAAGMLGVDAEGGDAAATGELVVRQLRASSEAAACAAERSSLRALATAPEYLVWQWSLRCPGLRHALTIESHLFEQQAPHHLHFAHVRGQGRAVDRILSGAERATVIQLGKTESVSFARALRLGVTHLLSGPDHLVFLLMLVLASAGLRTLAIAITGFTLGHSVTLALGALGLVHPHGALVETLIGASIVVVAVERTWDASRLRASVAATFGLVHGLGFAGALTERGFATADLLPVLCGFNLGIEFAQLCIAALALTILSALRKRSTTAAVWTADVATAAACGAGVYWAVTRLAA